jgi:hypothetical protein
VQLAEDGDSWAGLVEQLKDHRTETGRPQRVALSRRVLLSKTDRWMQTKLGVPLKNGAYTKANSAVTWPCLAKYVRGRTKRVA